jgi:hypothetical protein
MKETAKATLSNSFLKSLGEAVVTAVSDILLAGRGVSSLV